MRALILAAGRGSRLGAITDAQPKALVRLWGRALLEWQVTALRAGGVREIGIVTGYRAGDFQPYGFTTFHNARWQETNMARSLMCAAKWLEETPCIVSYADIFYEPAAVATLANSADPIALTYDVNWQALWSARFADPLADAETFRIDEDGGISEIGARARTMAEIQGQYMGLLRFTPAGWRQACDGLDGLPEVARDSLSMTAWLSRLIGMGVRVRGCPYRGRWGEVDGPSDLAFYAAQPALVPGLFDRPQTPSHQGNC